MKGMLKLQFKNNMFINWNPQEKCVNAAQKYSAAENLIMVIKPTGINKIINIAPPKFIKTENGEIVNDLSGAYERRGAEGMAESDWLGPHYINWNWCGGTHGTYGGEGEPTGFSENAVIKLNGDIIDAEKEISQYAESFEMTWDTYAGSINKADAFLKERHLIRFDGVKWDVKTEIEFFKDLRWITYHGLQCVYGIWNGTVTYNGSVTAPIDKNADGETYMTESGIRDCETILLKKAGDCLEMYLDKSYGIGDRRYLKVDSGAFTATYNDAKNGKAYFSLVRGGNGIEIKAGETAALRGHYRFYSID